jgi:hypothetical protein
MFILLTSLLEKWSRLRLIRPQNVIHWVVFAVHDFDGKHLGSVTEPLTFGLPVRQVVSINPIPALIVDLHINVSVTHSPRKGGFASAKGNIVGVGAPCRNAAAYHSGRDCAGVGRLMRQDGQQRPQ